MGRIAAAAAPAAFGGTAEAREGGSRRAAVKRKELLVERHELGRGPIDRSGDGVHAAERQLSQYIVLKRRRGHGGGGHDRERNPHPFGIEEEEQLVVDDGASQTASEVIHRDRKSVV